MSWYLPIYLPACLPDLWMDASTVKTQSQVMIETTIYPRDLGHVFGIYFMYIIYFNVVNLISVEIFSISSYSAIIDLDNRYYIIKKTDLTSLSSESLHKT